MERFGLKSERTHKIGQSQVAVLGPQLWLETDDWRLVTALQVSNESLILAQNQRWRRA